MDWRVMQILMAGPTTQWPDVPFEPDPKKRLRLLTGSGYPPDLLNQIAAQLEKIVQTERDGDEHLPHVDLKWTRGEGSPEMLEAFILPVRTIGVTRSARFELDAFDRITPSWLLPLVDVLSAVGSLGILGGLACLARGVPLRLRARRRIKRGACVACGYDLEGLGVCPECGRVK